MKITMAHGSGGRATSQLITGIFEKILIMIFYPGWRIPPW